MSITTTVQSALSALMAAHPDLVVSAQIGGVSGSGLSVMRNKQNDPDIYGQSGSTIGTVRVSAATFSEPSRGAHITVDGKQVHVSSCRTSGGIMVIEYSDTQPVSGAL